MYHEGEIREGLRNSEFRVYYQPVCETSTGICCGAEALARWIIPGGRKIAPDSFIQATERVGLIIPFTQYIFDHIVRDVNTWHVPAGFRLSVNISASHLAHPGFIHDMMVFSSGLKNKSIRLMAEITESGPVTDTEQATRVLEYLQQKGVLVALDDFGTGYNSRKYLRALPLDCLKIDKSFIETIKSVNSNSPVLDNIIHLACELGLETIAEGVSTEIQRRYLQNSGVPLIQGYLNSVPLDSEAFQAWFTRHKN